MATNLSKPAIVAGILSLPTLLSFAVLTDAWLPSPLHHTAVTRNTRSSININIINDNIHHVVHRKQSATNQLSLFKYKDDTDSPSAPIINLTPEQDQILRDSRIPMEESYGISWFDETEPWDALKIQYATLQQYTNEELRLAYIKQKPTVGELFTKTPLGPFLVLNGVFWLGGFSWCDTPFHGADACLP